MAVHFIGGVNGVGKSSIVDRLVQGSPDILRVHTTSRFMEWLGIEMGNYDALRELPDDFKTEQNQHMLQDIVSQANDTGDTVILDSHFLTLKEGFISPPLLQGSWVARLGSMALVNSDTQTIMGRLQKSARDRKLFASTDTPEQQFVQLETYQQRTFETFSTLAGQYALPHMIVENGGSIDNAAEAYHTFITAQKEGYHES